MDFTAELSKSFSLSPFDILEQDKDYVIMLINYYIEKGERAEEEPATTAPRRTATGEKRVRVTDATATGGWY